MVKGRLAVISSLVGILILLIAACAPAATPTPTATPTSPPVVATPTPGVAIPTPAPGVATPTPAPVAATPTLVAGMPVGYGYSPFGEWGMPLNMPPPQYGGIFRQLTPCMPATFDMHRVPSCGGNIGSGPIFDGLVRFSPYMDVSIIKDTYALEHVSPNLAERWEVSPDNLSVTFYLKKGVKWHDGKPFTAKDVVYSFDKLRDPQRSVFATDLIMVDRVERVDDYTVKVYLKYPATRFFLLIIAYVSIAMEAEHKKDVGHRDTEFLMGTGPFKLKSYTAGIEEVYEKNTDYHFKGRPYLDGVKHLLGTNPQGVETLVVGQTDYFEVVSSEQGEALIKRVAPEIIREVNPKVGALSVFLPNFRKETPMGDVRVRKALVMIVDRTATCIAKYGKELSKRLCEPRGGYFASEPIGRGLPFEEYEKAWGLNRPLEERVAEAKKLLAEAGYPNGFKIEFVDAKEISGEYLVVMDVWRRLLNVETVARIIPAADRFLMLGRGEFGFAAGGIAHTVAAMEEFVGTPFATGGKFNWGGYTHPEVDRLYEKLMQEPDFDKAKTIFHQVERILIADIPQIYLNTWNQLYAYWPYVKPKFFMQPLWLTNYNSRYTVIWLDKNDPTWAKRAR